MSHTIPGDCRDGPHIFDLSDEAAISSVFTEAPTYAFQMANGEYLGVRVLGIERLSRRSSEALEAFVEELIEELFK